MHSHSRLQSVLSHLQQDETSSIIDIERIDRNLIRIFRGIDFPSHNAPRIILSACNGDPDPGEPSDRFVSLSRNLQNEKSSKKERPVYRNRPAVSEDKTPFDALYDPRVLLGVASTGLALAFLPSSSPVSRSLLSRLWPQVIQVVIAYLVYIRKKQDERTGSERSNAVLYIATALLQFFTAIRDFQGHSPNSLIRSALLGPVDPLLGYMKSILLGLPTFVFKTIFLSGIAMVGKITIAGLIVASIIGSLGLLIVLAAENL